MKQNLGVTMSKASEYIAGLSKARDARPKGFSINGEEEACVCKDGSLSVFRFLNGKEALELAKWITETFGDNE